MKKNVQSRKSRKEQIFTVLLAIILVACIILIIKTLWEELSPEADYRDMSAKYTNMPDEEEGTEPEEDEWLSRIIDFDSLQAENPEIVGWITIPNTVIDYPICRSVDDEDYYLTHNANKEKSVNGAIFIRPDTSFQDTSLVVYGHNMRIGIMFGMLSRYQNDDYLKEHPYVYFYTPEENFKTEVFYSGEVDSMGDAYLTGWEKGTKEYGEWLQETFPVREAVTLSHPLTMYDQIFILSTCVSSNAGHRYIVTSVVRDTLRIHK